MRNPRSKRCGKGVAMELRGVRLVWGALALCLATTVSAAKPQELLRGDFDGEVAVAESGDARIVRIEGVTGALEQLVRAKLSQTRWVPGMRDGKPVAATVPFSGRLVLAPAGEDDYVVQEMVVRVAPKTLRAIPPTFRPPVFKEGVTAHAEVRLHLDHAGHVAAVDTVSVSSPSVERQVREALRKWRFSPLPEGLATMTIGVPIWFQIGTKPLPKAEFACARDPALPAWPEQDGCLDLIEVTAVRAGSVSI